MSDSPLYQQTLSDVLQRARRDAERAEARWALAERRAAERADQAERAARLRVAEAERAAAQRVAEAERRAALAEREARARRALLADEVAEEVEERVRAALAHDAPPLPALAEQDEPQAPPLPSAQEIFRSNPGVGRFLDSLLGTPGS